MQLSHILLALLVVIIWGFNFVVIKVGLEKFSPLLLGFARFFLTSIPAVFFIKKPPIRFKMVLLYGLVMFALQFCLLFMGMHMGITPGLASLLLQLQVFFTMFLANVFFQEKLHLWQIIGALISFIGISVIALNLGANMTLTSFLLVISAAASWALGNVISKKIGKVNMVSLVVWASLVAWPPLLAISFLVEGTDNLFYTLKHLNLLSSSAVLYITYLSTLLGFGIWSYLLHHHCLTKVAPFTLLVPVFGILSSVLVLKEPLQLWKIIATILVISGLCINLIGPKIFSSFQKK